MEGKQSPGRTYSILSLVFAGLSLIVLPIIFGPIGVIFGVIATIKGDKKLGITGIILSVVLAVLSTLIAMYLLSQRGA
jgi:hypothetical protein